jgi:hypothetical protein
LIFDIQTLGEDILELNPMDPLPTEGASPLFLQEEIEAMRARVKLAVAPWIAAEARMQRAELEQNRDSIQKDIEKREQIKAGTLLDSSLFTRTNALRKKLFRKDLFLKGGMGSEVPLITRSPHVSSSTTSLHQLPCAKINVHETKFRAPNKTVRCLATQLPDTAGLPASSMWTVLKSNYKVEDDPVLRFVPYFGDDDNEDIVTEVFNIKGRKDAQHLASMERKESKILHATKSILFDNPHLVPNLDPVPTMDPKEEAAKLKKEDPVFQRLDPQVSDGAVSPTKTEEAIQEDEGLIPEGPEKRLQLQLLAVAMACTEEKLVSLLRRERDDMAKKAAAKVKKDVTKETYEDFMDSFRTLFCRRCYVYDCRVHGCAVSKEGLIAQQVDLSLMKEEAQEKLWIEHTLRKRRFSMISCEAKIKNRPLFGGRSACEVQPHYSFPGCLFRVSV